MSAQAALAEAEHRGPERRLGARDAGLAAIELPLAEAAARTRAERERHASLA